MLLMSGLIKIRMKIWMEQRKRGSRKNDRRAKAENIQTEAKKLLFMSLNLRETMIKRRNPDLLLEETKGSKRRVL
jgi:hypothetical protein